MASVPQTDRYLLEFGFLDTDDGEVRDAAERRCVYVCEDDAYKIKASCCVAPAPTNIVPLLWWLYSCDHRSLMSSFPPLSLLSAGFISVHSAFMDSGE